MTRQLLDENSGTEATAAAPNSGDSLLDLQLRSHLSAICALVHKHTNNDFSQYKQGTLLRRIRHRMQTLHLESVAEYIDILVPSRFEAEALGKDLLIGVTQFFRDPETFEFLERQVLPRITQDKSLEEALRIWVPGCASGEEAYTIAILIREHLDRIGQEKVVQLFATDLDTEMLAEARQGRYPQSICDHMSAERLTRFFVHENGGYLANKELR
jgi:two-component system CheB/CheR fusion protein